MTTLHSDTQEIQEGISGTKVVGTVNSTCFSTSFPMGQECQGYVVRKTRFVHDRVVEDMESDGGICSST